MDPLVLSSLIFSSASIDDGRSWNSMGFSDVIVSVVTDEQNRIVVLDREGHVFRMSTGGRWEEIFSKERLALNPEELLLDAESTMGEILEGVDIGETYYDEDLEQTIIEEGQQSFDDELQGGIFDPLRERSQEVEGLGLYAADDVLLLCLDVCYESSDGSSWSELSIPLVRDLISMEVDERSLLLAATERGLWYRKSRGNWTLANLSLRNFSFTDLERIEGGALVASPAGLFRSSNALFWRRQGTLKNIQSMVQHNETLFLSTESGLYISEDLGDTTQLYSKELGQQIVMRSESDVLWLLSEETLYTIEENQVLNQQRNLFEEGYHSLVPWRNGLVLGGERGVYLLSEEEELMTVMMPHSLEDVLGMVLYDVDLQARQLSIQNPLLTGALSPVVSLTGSFDRDMGITIDYGGISSFAQERLSWSVGLNVCFGRCGSIASSATESMQQDELMVINGAVYSQGGVAAAATGLELGLNKTRKNLFDRTIALYQSHRRLLMQKERMKTNPSSMAEHIFLTLELEEVVALLNALTQGRYENIQITK